MTYWKQSTKTRLSKDPSQIALGEILEQNLQ